MNNPVPAWLKKIVGENKAAQRTNSACAIEKDLSEKSLNTVCHEAKCPNRGRCFSEGDATFLILGNICTRNCKFCAVEKNKPLPPDDTEPQRIADTAKKWGLKYAVITSPTRDDLPDGGADHYAKTIKALLSANIKAEPLIPDFGGNADSLKIVLDAKPHVLAHNIEMVPRLYKTLRARADYGRSLKILEQSKKLGGDIPIKSGLMLGLGETNLEIEKTLYDMLNSGCDMLTLGQYLAPSKNHCPVERYLEPQEFSEWDKKARQMGFKAAMSGPLVRSSYRAGWLYLQYKNTQK